MHQFREEGGTHSYSSNGSEQLQMVILSSEVWQVEVMSQLLHCQPTHLLLEGMVLVIEAAGVLKTLVAEVFCRLYDAFHL
ncbi:hypothetical protein E2C01_000907 [Portunus trituberculatus]|uniref:Uncharacterized protein n=1 Tax=Portunus trituberculatus TaxID=210409 RepID=A0A5B7CGG6_PORTR|nr:hypothetical protein [Portunus trituberculatus]